MKKILAMILIMVFMVTGCGKVDEEPLTKTTEKKEEIAMVDNVENEEDTEVSGEEIVTDETAEETPTESAPVEPVQESDKRTSTNKTETKKSETKKTTETTASAETTPIVSEPIATPVPEATAQECQHWYQPVEEIEYEMLSHYVFASNCCGYPLFTIENNDAVNVPDLYVHPDYYDEESGIECTKKFTSWHSDYFYSGFCYSCNDSVILRTCTVFYNRAELCMQNEGALGAYERVEPGHAYIKACSCGQNSLVTDGLTGRGLMVKKMICSYCGHVKTYPEQ